MGLASIIDSLATNSIPPYTIVSYLDIDSVDAGSDSTSLIELELPGLYTTGASYINEPRIALTSKSYVIDLAGIAVSCSSTNFTIRLLTRNDINLINTQYEVIRYNGINLSFNDTFERFIIRNRDIVLNNKLYLHITNDDVVETGNISIELTYVTLQDREF